MKVAWALAGLRKHMVWHRRTRAGLRAAASPALSWLQISAASSDLTQTFITSSALGFPGPRFMYDPRRRLCCEEYLCLPLLLSCAAQCLFSSLTSGARAGKTRVNQANQHTHLSVRTVGLGICCNFMIDNQLHTTDRLSIIISSSPS